MKFGRRTKLLIEPPSVATGDIAFNLIVFFLVCASVTPDTGRKQDVPRAEPKKDEKEQSKPIEVRLTRSTVFINGNVVAMEQLEQRLSSAIREKDGSAREIAAMPDSSKIVVVSTKDNKDTPYHHWIAVTSTIARVGGIVTLQLEEDREVAVE